jgi:pyruvate/2-oxoglutarate/acetoin dehydrogenase E1 component/TPP-dependent pyruvate/acetoin dehydrogenase alpha subunit
VFFSTVSNQFYMSQVAEKRNLSKSEFREEVLNDYRVAYESRQASLMGRKEVLTGKAKFGIFGDGKEVAQLAMAKVFKHGDFRSGYYRDQTFMFAKGMSNVREFFAQLYAITDVEAEPASAGRSMNGHFGTRLLNDDGSWKKQTETFNSSSDISPTAGQMSRLVGLAWASKLYRENELLSGMEDFSINGNEIAFGTIGNASTSEGPFWESINAAGVLQIPMLVSIWDDNYGISVPAKYQTTKENLSSILKGFKTDKDGKGYDLYTVKGWDYPELLKTYAKAADKCRKSHTPAIIHVTEVTQPQGHSTSGSHERYKSKDRLAWEAEYDCIAQMRQWIIKSGLANEEELDSLEADALQAVKDAKKEAWNAYLSPLKSEKDELVSVLTDLAGATQQPGVQEILNALSANREPIRKDLGVAAVKAMRLTAGESSDAREALLNWYKGYKDLNFERYSSHLHSQSEWGSLNVNEIPAAYSDDSPEMNGFEILQNCFDLALTRDPRVMAFGEDVGHIGDVNQGFAGLQEKHGLNRVMDTGIRENTIIGQAVGAALRGLRPIAEIQYLDYLIYAIQIMSDDIATLQYRTKGGQKNPVIIRTRGHRLEGIWHSGSPMAMIINAVRGMHVLVPRNMVKAAGFYNTLLQSDEPALVVECLNGYRLKEKMPDNLGSYTMPLGEVEVIQEGTDVTLVTYGSCVRIAQDAMKQLEEQGISVELIDVQSLLPFDLNKDIVKSLEKTNRVVFLDEDVPGGTTAYMMQQVLEKQNGYMHLDSAPKTISSRAHRPAYGTDGDYFSKPNAEDIFMAVYNMMHEADPTEFPALM